MVLTQHSFESLAAVVQAAVNELLDDLDRAEGITHQWTDEKMGETLIGHALDHCLAKLSATGIWGRENQLLSSVFWQIAGPRLECGSMQLRARSKPRGYAGDFETLMMFDERFECEHPLGRLFDRYFQRQAAVEAVRARTELIATSLVECVSNSANMPFGIASIGCGPAIEIERAIKLLPENHQRRLRIQLFDLDEAALDHATVRLGRLLNADQCSIHRENLNRLGQRASDIHLLQPADFIFCTGLFDYLDDEVAVGLLRFLWQQLLHAGGTLMVGNFTPHNPTRAYMEWIGNWYLTYRTPAQLATLADAAVLPREQRRISNDRTGIDLFLIAKKLDA